MHCLSSETANGNVYSYLLISCMKSVLENIQNLLYVHEPSMPRQTTDSMRCVPKTIRKTTKKKKRKEKERNPRISMASKAL